MTDAARANATARRDAALAEIIQYEERISVLRKEISRIEAFLQLWAEFASGAVENVDNSSPLVSSDDPSVPLRARPKNPKKEEVTKVALDLIRTHARPIQRDELFQLLTQNGYDIQGTNPEMVLSTMLWRMQERIVRLPRFGYWPREQPYAPAGYDPNLPYLGDAEHAEMVNRDLSGTLPDEGNGGHNEAE